MMRAAFVQSVSLGYLPGVCALLTQLERNNHQEDVWIVYWDDIQEDVLSQIADASEYDGKIFFQPISQLRERFPVTLPVGAKRGWETRFYKHLLMSSLSTKYDAVCSWGGDMLLLDNISKYLQIGQQFIVLGNNPYSKVLAGQSADSSAWSESSNPYTDAPFITSNMDLLRQIWKEGQDKDIRARGRGDMLCLHRAITQLGIHHKVFQVPYSSWVRPWLFSSDLMSNGDWFGFKDKSKIHSVHGKLWSKGHCLSEARRSILPDDKILPMLLKIREIYIKAWDKCGMSHKAFK